MMLKSIKSKALLYKLFMSYFFIFVIPLVIMTGFLYKTTVTNLRDEISSSNMNKLIQIKDILDGNMKDIEEMAAKVDNDIDLSPYVMPRDTSHQMHGIETLQMLKTNTAFVDDFFFYSKNMDSFFSPSGYNSPNTFISKYFYEFENTEDKDKFFYELNTVVTHKMVVLNKVSYKSSKNPKELAYLFPVAFSKGKPGITMIFTIKKQAVDKLISDLLGDLSGSAFIYTKDGLLLSSVSNKTQISADKMLSLLDENKSYGLHGVYNDGKEYSLINLESDYTGWRYGVIIESSQFFKKVDYMKTLILQVVMSLLVFGIFTMVIFAKQNYKPIGKLADIVGQELPQPDNAKRMSDIDNISNAVTTAIKQNRDLKDQINSQLPLIEEQFLTKLLKGEISDAKVIQKFIFELQIKLNGPLYAVMVLNRDSSKDNTLTGKDKDSILMIIRQDITSTGIAYPVELLHDNAIALIVNLEKAGDDIDNKEQIAVHIKETIEKQFGEEIIIGIGKTCDSLLQLNRSFMEALAAIENNIVRGNNKVLFFDAVTENQKQLYWYPTEDQLRYIQSLKQGEKGVAQKALHEMCACIEAEEASFQMLRYVCFDIVNMVIKTVNEMNLTELDSDVANVMQFTSLNSLKNRLGVLTVKICEAVEERKRNKDSELNTRIIDYINSNFDDSNLSLEMVSEQFNLSSYYFSRLFKDISGMTFTDYITKLRMDKAKYMLINTKDALKDVVTSIGYTDLASFIRKFKKIEGITPGEYRRMYSNTDEQAHDA